MTDSEREALKRELAAVLRALQQDKRVLGLNELAARLGWLGSSYRCHAVLIQVAAIRNDEQTIISQLIQVLDKLEHDAT